MVTSDKAIDNPVNDSPVFPSNSIDDCGSTYSQNNLNSVGRRKQVEYLTDPKSVETRSYGDEM